MNSYIIWLIFIPGLCAIFMFTKASFMDFLLGFGLCLLGEAIVIICYCVVKVQQALIDSSRIKLQENHNLNVQKQYPFRDRKEVGKIFLNKYTEEQKLQTKKNTLKVHSFQNYLSEEEILNEQPKREILRFLKQKHNQNNLYNCFNTLLITLGQSLSTLQYPSKLSLITKKYQFQTIQSRSPCEINQKQLQNEQRQLLDQLEIKIMIKKDHQQNIVLPSWTIVIDGLQRVGVEFLKIKQMHDSNQQIIDMVKTKIIQDFQFIQSQIKKSLKSLDQIQKTSLQLKKENDQFLSNQRNIAQHQMDFMLLLKQHYYKYQDFQLRIKENQKNYHLQTKKLSYFKEKLSTFYRKNRDKYQKIFKTRFFAIFDSYNITIDESIKVVRTVLKMSHSYEERKPPKVNKLETHKNVDQQIQAERKYQQQYFERARFYYQLSQQLVKSIHDMSIFLQKIQVIFHSLCSTLQSIQKRLNIIPQGARTFTYTLILRFSQIMSQLSRQASHLLTMHSTFKQTNTSCLLQSQTHTHKLLDSSSQLLSQLSNPQQPLQHKYKLVKIQLQSHYQSIQHQIKQIKTFHLIYNQHSNRIKKILLIQVLYFLQLQKLYINESDFIKQSITGDGMWIGHNQLAATGGVKQGKDTSNNKEENNQEEKEQNHIIQTQEQSQGIENIYTGQYLCEDYIKVINRFLFSAYSQWKNSQFFKQTLTKELYVLLNKDQNESISQVTIMNLQLLGYPPEVLSIRELHSQPFEFLADISIAFKGKLLIYLKTEYKLMGLAVPTEVKVEVQEFYCCIRICFVPSQVGQSWFSFIGQPNAKFTVQPKIYTISINVETIRNFFSTLLLNKLKQSTFPIREKIMIPVSKEDPMLQLIQKRLKSTYHF